MFNLTLQAITESLHLTLAFVFVVSAFFVIAGTLYENWQFRKFKKRVEK
jgi:hypothetical protein